MTLTNEQHARRVEADVIADAMRAIARTRAEAEDPDAKRTLLRCYATLAELRRVVMTMAADAAKGRAA